MVNALAHLQCANRTLDDSRGFTSGYLLLCVCRRRSASADAGMPMRGCRCGDADADAGMPMLVQAQEIIFSLA